MIALATIQLDPTNPRIIRDHKFKQLVESLRTFPRMMELKPLVIDATRTIKAGNQRYKALKELNYAEVPEAWVKLASDFTEAELKEFMVRDNISAGEFDLAKLELGGWKMEEVKAWGAEFSFGDEDQTKELEDTVGAMETEAELFDEENANAVVAFNNDPQFLTELGPLDIPRLNPEMFGAIDPTQKVLTWIGREQQADCYLVVVNSNKPPERDLSDFVLAFYTDDARFEAFYNTPAKYLIWCKRRGIKQIIMPNYSMYHDMPQISRLYNLYRSRFVARYFQEGGVRVIPDIQLNNVDYHYVIEGLPKGLPMLSIQFHTNKKDEERYAMKIRSFHQLIEDLEPETLLLYVDARSREDLGKLRVKPRVVMVDSFMTQKRLKRTV